MNIPVSPPRLAFHFDQETNQTILVGLALSNQLSLSKNDLASRISSVAVGAITEQLSLRMLRLMAIEAGSDLGAPPVALSMAELLILKMAFEEAPWTNMPSGARYPEEKVERARKAINEAMASDWPQEGRLQNELQQIMGLGKKNNYKIQ